MDGMASPGSWVLFLVCLIAALLAVPAASHTGVETTFSLACSSAAFVGMGLSQFMATRAKPVEQLFGGLDKVYAAHRKLGIAIFVLILAHYFITPNFKGLALTSSLNELAGEIGEFAFYALVTLIVISLVSRIPKTRIELPYQFWRFTHRFIGVAFILVAIHMNFIKRPFDSTALLAVYLNIFAALGVLSYLYTQFLAPMRRQAYEVAGIMPLDGATLIQAKPQSRPVRIKPGQFAFMRSTRKGLGEPHPFTVAGTKEDGSVLFAIKPLGDFTSRLRSDLQVGDKLTVEGGYGSFDYTRGQDRQIWLAGGIGITPFLAKASAMTAQETRNIHLVYAVRDKSEAVGLKTLQNAAERVPGFSFTLHESANGGGRLDAEKLAGYVPFEAKQAELWFCGPPGLRSAIVAGLKKIGKAPSKVKFEQFQFR
jgi:predicted ferric reductase